MSNTMKVNDFVMDERIKKIVLYENKPFNFSDFLEFVHDGKSYEMAHGTFRNKIAERKKTGIIKVAYRLKKIAYYTLSYVQFEKPKQMKEYHMITPMCHPILKEMQSMPMKDIALHDIKT